MVKQRSRQPLHGQTAVREFVGGAILRRDVDRCGRPIDANADIDGSGHVEPRRECERTLEIAQRLRALYREREIDTADQLQAAADRDRRTLQRAVQR